MAEGEVKKQPPPPVVEPSLKIYISQASTYFGKTLISELSAPAPSKVEHTFYTSDSGIVDTKKEGISEIWKVFHRAMLNLLIGGAIIEIQ
jgi:hypothetical protein